MRSVDPEFAPGHEVKFADGFPILVARQVHRAEVVEDYTMQHFTEFPPKPNVLVIAACCRAIFKQ